MRSKLETSILVRLSRSEKVVIEQAAAFEERSVNQWCRIILVKMAKDINRLPPQA